MYLIRWTKEGEIAPEHRDAVFLVPEWKYVIEKIGLTHFRCISLYVDYESPYRFRDEGVDREMHLAKAQFGETKIPKWKTKAMEDAKTAYSFLQKDTIREHLKSQEQQLAAIDEYLGKTPSSVKEIKESLAARKDLKVIRSQIYEVRAEIADSIKEIQLKGGKIQSWLERRAFEKKQIQEIES